MPRYVALLRGVSPMNCKMPALKACLEDAGFTSVKTLLSSGNAVFDARKAAIATLERKCEQATADGLGHRFSTLVRPQEELAALLAADPFARFKLPPNAKRIVTFLRTPYGGALKLPIEFDNAQILAVQGAEALSAYVPDPGNPAFMRLIEKTFGKDVTTRTWDTVKKCCAA
ncbi:DUF1697 domain-containing protein [Ramlibacter sp.]|uniref:DUF1697 domain-containing protein n=1 Tax=Ramlibacter sp. TaxID=1917967 RepID=UPI0017EF323F|nr:DUF1697 domain-containing protein [Ramlibacter sp.]MBA2675259.1 DUF1697 domain-containing protein [Ramlibacter sp.]